MAVQDEGVVAAPQAADLRAAREIVDDTAGRLSREALARKIDERWSAAEILEHLTLAFTANAATLEKALASGETRIRRPAITQTLLRFLVVDLGYFPKVRTPARTEPSGGVPPERSLTAVREALTSLDAVLTRVALRFGVDEPVANHPYFAAMSVAQWRKFHRRHTVHHMRQLRARTS